MDVQDILDKLKNKNNKDIALITKAFLFAQEKHKGEFRSSQEPYFVHPWNVACTLAEMQMDAPTIAAGLLHDVCETSSEPERQMRAKEILSSFGKEVAALVQGVTKIGTLKYRGIERYLENMRKMFIAIAEDMRVIFIRLADRLHNIQTLSYLPRQKQERIARETLEVYAPLADRLGMGKLKGLLEDYAFPYVFPAEHKEISEKIKKNIFQKEIYLAKMKYKISEELKKAHIAVVMIDSRVKHEWSLYKKLARHNNNFDEIYDLIAIRIIVHTVADCYGALGIIHQLWKPLPGRIKDYIAFPKPNGYQSLHTTVFCADGEITELQIRTLSMHEIAENGIAAHWIYTSAYKPDLHQVITQDLTWTTDMQAWKDIAAHNKNFKGFKLDIFKNRIFVLTPKGDVINLPEGSTVVDFAYHVHSKIGDQCNGAKVNHRMVSLESILHSGDQCEILINKKRKPSRSWLRFVTTSHAKSRIRAALKE